MKNFIGRNRDLSTQNITKTDLRETGDEYVKLKKTVMRQGLMVDSCEGHESCGFYKGQFLHQVNKYHVNKETPVLWGWLRIPNASTEP
jgi:hypothetical protein